MKKRLIVTCLIAALLLPAPAYAWNEAGHKVVTLIAWDQMKPQTRQAVIALLKEAPADADLAKLFSNDSRPLAEREREFFLRASTWADIVRDDDFPERRKKFHHSLWHFINFFFDQSGPGGAPRDRDDLRPEPENVVERLQRFQSSIADRNLPANQRAIELAWILHLAGDIHQPLHCSARVTRSEPQGDRGGNLFLLERNNPLNNLHSYWDGILNRTFRRSTGETEQAFLQKIANFIVARHPRPSLAARIKPGEFEAWAKEGHATTKASVYPQSLRRNQTPSQTYRQNVSRIAEPAIALAGYRLAEMLDRTFGN